MARFTNETKGARTIRKTDGSRVLVDVGATVSIPKYQVFWYPPDLTVGGEAEPEYGPLDHDRDGKPGGSTAPDDPKEALRAKRAEYQLVMKKRPFSGWDIDELNRRMDEAAAKAANA